MNKAGNRNQHIGGLFFFLVACILMHEQITHGTLFNPFGVFVISCVACNLLHDQTTHGTLFNPFGVFVISCNKLHATILIIS